MSKKIKFTISGDANEAYEGFAVINARLPKRSNALLFRFQRAGSGPTTYTLSWSIGPNDRLTDDYQASIIYTPKGATSSQTIQIGPNGSMSVYAGDTVVFYANGGNTDFSAVGGSQSGNKITITNGDVQVVGTIKEYVEPTPTQQQWVQWTESTRGELLPQAGGTNGKYITISDNMKSLSARAYAYPLELTSDGYEASNGFLFLCTGDPALGADAHKYWPHDLITKNGMRIENITGNTPIDGKDVLFIGDEGGGSGSGYLNCAIDFTDGPHKLSAGSHLDYKGDIAWYDVYDAATNKREGRHTVHFEIQIYGR